MSPPPPHPLVSYLPRFHVDLVAKKHQKRSNCFPVRIVIVVIIAISSVKLLIGPKIMEKVFVNWKNMPEVL